MKISIKAARINCNMNQTVAAEKLGINRTTLVNYEKGYTYPTTKILAKMEQIYGVPVEGMCIQPATEDSENL